MDTLPDHYETLGIKPGSTDAAIKSAYRALMQKYHPDTFRGDRAIGERKAREINGAYEILGHAEKRERYDAERRFREAKASESTSDVRYSGQHTPAQKPPATSTTRGWAILALIGLIAIVGVTVVTLMRGQGPAVMETSTSSDVLSAPALIAWQTDGSRRTYHVGDIAITMYAWQIPGSTNQAPVMVVNADGLPPVEIQGQPRFQTAMASILVMRLDPDSASNEVVLATSTGDAHCCTQLTILERGKTAWKKINAGSWDGDILSRLPQDIDGDKVPDFVFHDDSFNYAFASYSDSHPPPMIFNLLGGVFINVSTKPRYADFFSREMTADQAGCLLHRNGACAAFVAIANRLGLHEWAWQYMLANYDREDTWPLPETCGGPGNACAPQTGTPDYPSALTAFLLQHGYADAGVGEPRPSFPCRGAEEPSLKLICSSPALAQADRDMAGAYQAALSISSQPESLRDEQQKWIATRNTLQTPDELQHLYDQRTADLIALAHMSAN